MTISLCFKCGAQKLAALAECNVCRTSPRADDELALSLVLSEHLSSNGQLSNYGHEIRNHLKLSIPPDDLERAKDALNDPQLLDLLGGNAGAARPGRQSSAGVQGMAGSRASASSIEGRARPKLKSTVLHQTPFAVLGVTTRDDRRRIVAQAEERSLEIDHDVCQKARSDLTTPRNRLSAEVAWLPGVSPRKASQLLEVLLEDPLSARMESGLPTLAHLNLLAASLDAVDGDFDTDDLSSFIQEIAYLQDDLDPGDVLRDINEDRTVSGFPEVKGVEQIEEELSERKRHYRNSVKSVLDKLRPASLVQVMTDVVSGVTSDGDIHAPELIDDLVDSYEVEAQGFLQDEARTIHKLIEAARAAASISSAAVKPYVENIELVARNWDKVAQPIQLSAKARGIDHEASRELAYEIRSLAIDLFNKHDMLVHSQQLTKLLQELFAEIPEVADRIDQDADALLGIVNERKNAAAKKAEWNQEITYRTEIGLIFKDVLSISPEGVSWKGQTFPLDSVTRVRWGGVSHSVNGVPTGTAYTIAFGDPRAEAVVELKRQDVYFRFIESLWKAVCVRLLGEMLEELRAGRELRFGEAVIQDDGVLLIRRKFLGANEKVKRSWAEIQTWSADGSFCIGAKDDKKANVAISYINTPNTHILEQAISIVFKKPGCSRMSDILR